ncbi:hypothetical protein GCM10011410_03800 [Hoyosella rhizosphaerae]|uniref:Uncharacterized protein n=2 Tax=Hoyosella rhizosphaerae TaxID=1755582 RepID=A0A916TZU8_9ACTN|nr:hypothetical protein GCM10011410_03800 [Hoyosella rhizosphaerae]
MVAAALAVTVPGVAAADHQPNRPLPYCEMLPMILIYPPPPTTIACYTPWGDFRFLLPPGTVWPF